MYIFDRTHRLCRTPLGVALFPRVHLEVSDRKNLHKEARNASFFLMFLEEVVDHVDNAVGCHVVRVADAHAVHRDAFWV